MSKAILISIKPKYVADILNGKKTIEIRKTMPKCDLPIDVYIYCTKTKKKNDYLIPAGAKWEKKNDCSGKVVAKFTLNKVEEIKFHCLTKTNSYGVRRVEATFTTQTLSFTELKKLSCLTGDDLMKYLNDADGYAIHINDIEIFDKPKELSEFCYYNVVKNNLYAYDEFPLKTHLAKAPQSWCYVEVE